MIIFFLFFPFLSFLAFSSLKSLSYLAIYQTAAFSPCVLLYLLLFLFSFLYYFGTFRFASYSHINAWLSSPIEGHDILAGAGLILFSSFLPFCLAILSEASSSYYDFIIHLAPHLQNVSLVSFLLHALTPLLIITIILHGISLITKTLIVKH